MNAPVATMDRPAPIVEFKASLDQREEVARILTEAGFRPVFAGG